MLYHKQALLLEIAIFRTTLLKKHIVNPNPLEKKLFHCAPVIGLLDQAAPD